MQWNAGYSESVHTFANTINTHEGGTHEEGFRAALTSVVNKYAKEGKLLKDKDPNLTGDDIREGLAAVISVKVAQPQFEGQTKTKLGNTEVKSFVQRICNEQLSHWFEANPSDAKTIVNRRFPRRRPASRAQSPGVGAPQERNRYRWRPASWRLPLHRPEQVRTLCGGGRLGGRLGQERPRLDVPGDPAARQDHQRREGAHRPVLKNTEVQAIITALGTGIHDEFDLDKLRYHKIVLMADADVDGQHISTLLLTLLFRFMRPADRERARLPAQPPLYKLKWQRSEHEFASPTGNATACSRRAVRPARRSTPTTASSATRGLAR